MLQRHFPTFSLLLLALVAACGGGGGGSNSSAPVPQWAEFRNDAARTGGFGGSILLNQGGLRFVPVDDGGAPAPISSSPAIGADGTVYVASEGGTLKAFATEDLSVRWSLDECATCCPADTSVACDPTLGPMVSSPALFRDFDEMTNLVIADTNGRVYRFLFDESGEPPVPACVACFAPDVSADVGAGATVSFRSSPTLTFNAITGTIASILIGAEITAAGETEPSAGKIYAINADGTVRWQFPARGRGVVGPVTSSPSIGLGQSVIAADGNDVVHILTRDGSLRRSVSVDGLTSGDAFLQPSLVSSVALFVGTPLGDIYAFNHDGTFRWSQHLDDQRFLNSLAIGIKSDPTPTTAPTDDPDATPTPTPDPNDPTPTPTITATPVTDFSTLIGVTANGSVVFFDSSNGQLVAASDASDDLDPNATVVSSPALSFDALLAFASTDGGIFTADTGSGRAPRFCVANGSTLCEADTDCPDDDTCDASYWPIRIPQRCASGANAGDVCSDTSDCAGATCARASIVSSPAIDSFGTIYVGAEDGYLYAVGATGTPARTATPTPTPTAAL